MDMPGRKIGVARWVAWLVLALSLCATALAWKVATEASESRARDEFLSLVEGIDHALSIRLTGYAVLLQSVGGFFSASDSVTREDWKKFCETIDLKKNYPAVQALAYARSFSAKELDAAVRDARASGLSDFSIRPPGERDHYVVNVYAEPFTGLNVKAIGYDMWQDVVRRRTMEQAMASGEPAITPKTSLKIDENKAVPAVIMYKHVRSATQEGFALIPLRIPELVADISPVASQGVRVSIYDGENASVEALFYAGPHEQSHKSKYSKTQTLDFAGKKWTLVFDSEPSLESINIWQSPYTVLVVGLFFSLLLFWTVRTVVSSERRAVIIAEQMTASLRERESELRKSNEEIARQKALVSSIADGTSDAVFFKDAAGRYQFANKEVLRVFNRSAAEVIGRDDTHFFPREQAVYLMSRDREILSGGKIVVHEEYLTTVDGDRCYMAVKGPVYDGEGNLSGLFGISRDITERKRMESEVEELSSRLQLATRSAGIGVWDLNVETDEMLWDERMLELYGFTDETFPGGIRAWETGLHPDDKERAWGEYQAALRGEKEFDTDFRVLHPDGVVKHLKADGVVLRNAEGKPLRVIGVNYDITAEKTAEEQVRASNQRYQQLVDHAREGIITVAPDGHFHFVNDGICEILGYSRDELIGLTIYDTYPARFVEQARTRMNQLLSSGWNKFERIAKKRDGSEIVIEASAWKTEDGCLQAIVRDITEKKAIEKELAASKELFSLFMKYSPVFTYIKEVTQTESRVLQASENFEQMVGIKGSDMVGKTMEELFPADFAAKITSDDWKVITDGVVLELEEELKDKTYTTIKFPIAQGGRNLLAGFTIDITERKRADEERFKHEQTISAIVENSKDWIWTINLSGVHTYSNKAVQDILGYSVDEFAGIGLELLHPDDLEMVNSIFPEWVSRRHGWNNFVLRWKAKDGSYHFLESSAVPIVSSQGELIGFQGVDRDVTERMRAEEAVKASERRFSQLIQNSYDTIVILDADGIQRYVSASAEKVHGYSPAELVDIPVIERMIHPEDQERVLAAFRQIVETGSGGAQYRHKRKSGGWVHLEARGTNQLDNPDIRGVVVNVSDVTERIKAQEEAARLREEVAQAQKLESIGKLAGGVAHDFNNMLGVILGHVELAQTMLGTEHPVSPHLKGIENAASRSAAITRQLLAFARKQAISPKVLNLNSAVEPMLKMIHRLIGEDIHLSWLPGGGLWNVKIDPSQVDQILANLATNARDAIPGSGSVEVRTGNIEIDTKYCAAHPGFLPGEYVVLTVADSGAGIAPEKLPFIFDPFFTTKDIGKGTGLGLATIYGIVKQNGGFIDVKSTLGQGSVFSIYLPKTDETSHDDQLIAANAKKGHETILVVEDEVASLRLLNYYLTSLGYKVIVADNPVEGIRIANSTEYIDLLLTDVVMPIMDGKQLADELRAVHKNMRCLFMSGYTSDVLLDRGVIPEDMNFIQKPYTLKDMGAKVRWVLDS